MVGNVFNGFDDLSRKPSYVSVNSSFNFDDDLEYVLLLVESYDQEMGIYLKKKDVPAFALSALEKAGWSYDTSPDGRHEVMKNLKSLVEIQEHAEEKAREVSELVPVAFELLKSVRQFHGKDVGTWEETHEEVKEEFLALARSARDMGAKK